MTFRFLIDVFAASAASCGVAFLCLVAGAVHADTGAGLDLNGGWDFRFEEGLSIEQTPREAFVANDVMCVPGCWDAMPGYYLKRGTGLYRKTFTVEKAYRNAVLEVDGMGLRGVFSIDGRDLGEYPYPYAKLEIPVGPLAKGEHEIFAALDNRFDWQTMKLARPYYDFYFYGLIEPLGVLKDDRKLQYQNGHLTRLF